MPGSSQGAKLFLQVREQDGIDVADGVDTLLVYLLAELEDAPRLTGLAEGPQQAAPALLADLLQRKGQSDTLAQLYAGAGQPAAGLALWKVCPLLVLVSTHRWLWSDTVAQLYAGAGQPAAGLALWKVFSTIPCSCCKSRPTTVVVRYLGTTVCWCQQAAGLPMWKVCISMPAYATAEHSYATAQHNTES